MVSDTRGFAKWIFPVIFNEHTSRCDPRELQFRQQSPKERDISSVYVVSINSEQQSIAKREKKRLAAGKRAECNLCNFKFRK